MEEELLDSKLKVAPTSAMVLLQAQPLYQTGLAGDYFSLLDFGDVQDISAKLNQTWQHYGTVLRYRKLFVRYLLEQYLQEGNPIQVCIPGAGLDPLSLYILEHHRSAVSGVYEIDAAHMPVKSAIYNRLLPPGEPIHFIQADITDTLHLLERLRDAGYSPEKPTLVIYEGVVHYVTDELFLNTMQIFRTPNKTNVVLMDYKLPEDKIPAASRPVYRALVGYLEQFIGGPTYRYDRQQMFRLIGLLHGEVAGIDSLQDIEFKLNGRNELFYEEGDGFLEMIAFYL